MSYSGNFDFILPTTIKFGRGRVNEVGEIAASFKGIKAMIITDKGIIKAGLTDKVCKSLEESKIEVIIFDEVQPNPRDTTIVQGVELAKKENVNVLIAVGGGSSMDTAKGIGAVLSNGGKIQDYDGYEVIQKPIMPLIAIPTTVGTGSEVTMWAVITDSEKKAKFAVGSNYLAPKVALLDPEMVTNLPGTIIAATGMDALTHAIEGYTCRLSEPITDALGLYAIELITKNIKKAAYTDCQESKSNMLLGSMIAGMCFGNTDTAAVHAMAETIGGLYDIPHGVANAILLPYVMEYNCIADTYKHSKIAHILGENIEGLSERDAAFKAVEAVRKLNKDLNMPSLREVGVLEKDLELLGERANANGSSADNLRKATKDDYIVLFKKALNS